MYRYIRYTIHDIRYTTFSYIVYITLSPGYVLYLFTDLVMLYSVYVSLEQSSDTYIYEGCSISFAIRI